MRETKRQGRIFRMFAERNTSVRNTDDTCYFVEKMEKANGANWRENFGVTKWENKVSTHS